MGKPIHLLILMCILSNTTSRIVHLGQDKIRELCGGLGVLAPHNVNRFTGGAGEYNLIYVVEFGPADAHQLLPAWPDGPGGSVSLMLRIAGSHLPRIKTANEVATTWVRERTAIPVPAVVRFDTSTANAIGHELILLERVLGVAVDRHYKGLSDGQIEHLVAQLVDIMAGMHRHRGWRHVGSLRLAADPAIGNGTLVVTPGPLTTEDFWQAPEPPDIWGPSEAVASLNPLGPFDGYAAFVSGAVGQYVRNVGKYASLVWTLTLSTQITEISSRL